MIFRAHSQWWSVPPANVMSGRSPPCDGWHPPLMVGSPATLMMVCSPATLMVGSPATLVV